jgi:hypothetical protein
MVFIPFNIAPLFFGYDQNGIKLWQYDNDSCFTNCQDIYKNIIPLTDGALFIGAYNDTSGNNQIRIKRISDAGNLLWQKFWNYPRLSPLYPLVTKLDLQGNIVIGFSSFGAPDYSENFAFAKFDTLAGNELWHFELADQSPVAGFTLDERIRSLEIDAYGNLYFTGDAINPFANVFKKYYFSINPGGGLNYFGATNFGPTINSNPDDLHLNQYGTLSHLATFSGITVLFGQDTVGGQFKWTAGLSHDSANFFPIQFVYDGYNYFVLSNYNYFIPDSSFAGGVNTNFHYSLTKIDTSGQQLWQKDYFTDWDSSSIQNGSGGAAGIAYCNNALFVASNEFTDATTMKMVLHKIDTSGISIWTDTTSLAQASMPLTDVPCNIYFSRSTQINTGGYLSTLTQKFSDHPLSLKVVDEMPSLIIYPNPASDYFIINTAHDTHHYHIKIFDASGMLLYSKDNKYHQPISVESFPSGVYFVGIYEDGFAPFYKKLVINH